MRRVRPPHVARESLPKQFIPLIGQRSTFQSIVSVVSDPAVFDSAVVITNIEYRFRVAEQLREIGAEAAILLEPDRRDSAAAVGAAVAWAAASDPKTVVAMLAADHVFEDGKQFARLCAQADYEADLEPRIEDLHGRVHRGAYRPQPSRRTYIPKADGKQRPLAIAALEDKVVQGATVMALNAIYEGDFCGFSYGFRPGRGPHDALDALSTAIKIRKVNWILDADIQNFFGAVSQNWLVRFLEHRIGDKRIIRMIQKWLKALRSG